MPGKHLCNVLCDAHLFFFAAATAPAAAPTTTATLAELWRTGSEYATG